MKNKKWWDRFGLNINVFLNINIGLVNHKNLRNALPQRFSRWETSLVWVEELARTQKDQMIPRGGSPCCCPGLWCWTDDNLFRAQWGTPILLHAMSVIMDRRSSSSLWEGSLWKSNCLVIRAGRKEGLKLFVIDMWKGKMLYKKWQAIVFSTG